MGGSVTLWLAVFCYESLLPQHFSISYFLFHTSNNQEVVCLFGQSTPLMKLMASKIGEVPFTMQGLANVPCLELCCWMSFPEMLASES